MVLGVTVRCLRLYLSLLALNFLHISLLFYLGRVWQIHIVSRRFGIDKKMDGIHDLNCSVCLDTFSFFSSFMLQELSRYPEREVHALIPPVI